MAAPRARGDGRRRGRVRHQLRHHPPRRRRQADPQPLGGPRRARGAVPGPGRQRPRRPRDQRRQRRAALRRDLRPAARARHPGHVDGAADQLDRQPPQGAGDAPRGHGEGLGGVAAGVAAAADVLDEHGRAVHAQHQPGVRRADGRHARGAAPAYADPAWRQRVRDAWASGPQGGLPPRWETYEIMESTANPSCIGRRIARRRRASATPIRSTCCSTSPSPSRR